MSTHQQLSTLIEYKPAVLRNNKELYIEYYFRSIVDGAFIRKKIKLNGIPGTKAQKLAYGRDICLNLNIKLKTGWSPEMEKADPHIFTSIQECFEEHLKLISDQRPDTIRTVKSHLDVLTLYINKQYKEKIFTFQFDNVKASRFMSWLKTERKVSTRTYNNYRTGLTTVWNYFINNGYCKDNPWQKMYAPKNNIKRRMYINELERKQLRLFCENDMKDYWRICLTSFHSLLRRKELTFLKVKDVFLDRRIIHCDPSWTKNKRDSYVTIPEVLIPWFLDLNLEAKSPEFYLFSTNFLPGPKKISPKIISDTFSKIRKDLKLSDRISFMSLRDTGIRQKLRDGVTIDDVSKQARHSTIEETRTYLYHDEVVAHEGILNASDF